MGSVGSHGRPLSSWAKQTARNKARGGGARRPSAAGSGTGTNFQVESRTPIWYSSNGLHGHPHAQFENPDERRPAPSVLSSRPGRNRRPRSLGSPVRRIAGLRAPDLVADAAGGTYGLRQFSLLGAL